MTSPPEERYTIVEREISGSVTRRFPEMAGEKTFRIFDTREQKYVRFGNHRDRPGAERHIRRLKARDGAVEEL